MPKYAFSAENFNLTELISNSIDDIIELTKQIELVTEQLDLNSENIASAAFAFSLERANSLGISILINNVLSSAVKTVEYNYDLYLDHLINALALNKNDIIKVTPDFDFRLVKVSIDMSPLGTVEEWGQAVNMIRKGLLHVKKNKMASKMWAEKIYGVDRENRKIEKTYKGRGKNAKAETRDITAKYKGRYRETIAYRIKALDIKKAPFWYLIEHGNNTNSLGEGTAYPSFGPQPFILKSEIEIKRQIEYIMREYRQQIYDAIWNRNSELSSIRGEGVESTVEKELEKLVEGTKTDARQKAEKIKWIRTNVEQVTDTIRKETYDLGGGKSREIGRNIRGRFASLKLGVIK